MKNRAVAPDVLDLDAAIMARRQFAVSLFEELRSRSVDVEGVTRASYGAGEQMAHDLLRGIAEGLGLRIGTDAVGNLMMTLEGRDPARPAWFTGSHLDSVHQGGNFDGAAGVVAAITVVAAMLDAGLGPETGLTVMAIRAEECSTWFVGRHGGHLGSRAALGLLDPSELDTATHIATGKTFAEMVDAAGFDSRRIREREPILRARDVAGFTELHIEQGPLLEHRKIPVGIVTGIRGCTRARNARTSGVYSHSGAVPHELRHDAVMATAEFVMALDREWEKRRGENQDLVVTFGKFSTNPALHAIVKVPGEVDFALDFRSQDAGVLQDVEELVRALAQDISRRRAVEIELGSLDHAKPALMDAGQRVELVDIAARLGIPALEMASGGGHDAADFAEVGVPTSMIFVRNDKGSHNPHEAMEIDDFMQATRLLGSFLAKRTGALPAA